MLSVRLFIIQSSPIPLYCIFFSLLFDLNEARTVNVCQLSASLFYFQVLVDGCQRIFGVINIELLPFIHACIWFDIWYFSVSATLFSETVESFRLAGGNVKRTINRMCIFTSATGCCLSDLKSTLQVPHRFEGEADNRKGKREVL